MEESYILMNSVFEYFFYNNMGLCAPVSTIRRPLRVFRLWGVLCNFHNETLRVGGERMHESLLGGTDKREHATNRTLQLEPKEGLSPTLQP